MNQNFIVHSFFQYEAVTIIHPYSQLPHLTPYKENVLKVAKKNIMKNKLYKKFLELKMER